MSGVPLGFIEFIVLSFSRIQGFYFFDSRFLFSINNHPLPDFGVLAARQVLMGCRYIQIARDTLGLFLLRHDDVNNEPVSKFL